MVRKNIDGAIIEYRTFPKLVGERETIELIEDNFKRYMNYHGITSKLRALEGMSVEAVQSIPY